MDISSCHADLPKMIPGFFRVSQLDSLFLLYHGGILSFPFLYMKRKELLISHGIIMRYLCLSFQRRTAPGGLLCAAEKMTGSHPSDFHSDEISPEMLPGMMVFRKDFIMAEKKKVVVAMSGAWIPR